MYSTIKEICLTTCLFVSTMLSLSANNHYIFTSESVTEGHPDKVCDQISDAILDEILLHDPQGRVACETVAGKNTLFITGEISTSYTIDIEAIARKTLKEIGYTQKEYGISAEDCQIITCIQQQSPDIAIGVDESEDHEQGAGDQGLMFGYASDETEELMPLPIILSHKLAKKLADLRKEKILPWLRPDGKAQVSVEYLDSRPNKITTIVVSAQHEPGVSQEEIQQTIKEKVINPICKDYLTEETSIYINPTGSFVIGGPEGDSGLTGRKIIVDTYGGMSRHGGGCFSGKDPSKVDRSAAYMARHIAKNIVAAKLARRCEIQIAYCIGRADPVSIYIDTFGTGTIQDEEIVEGVKAVFSLKPKQIIEYLDLKKPIYQKSACYGHFGRNGFSWEKTDRVDDLLQYFQKAGLLPI